MKCTGNGSVVSPREPRRTLVTSQAEVYVHVERYHSTQISLVGGRTPTRQHESCCGAGGVHREAQHATPRAEFHVHTVIGQQPCLVHVPHDACLRGARAGVISNYIPREGSRPLYLN